MELWIRTQSKQSLVKVDNVSITEQTKTRYNVDSGEWILGRYNSFERALEVLDEIQKFIESLFESAIEIPAPIYNMPKE